MKAKTIANILRPAVVGDTGDRRTLKLTGATDLATATDQKAWVWRTGIARVEIPVTIVSATESTVEVDLGPWLSSAATAADWWFEVEVYDGSNKPVTWPGARQPATLPVRAQAG